ncbi:hypothetical protein F5I97DRAFT_1798915 [Phlebopus sp. FC_14]|nr:hypothetical protein F5I97DRAFT_1798915 [Phlebopus sp. FC_14]
MSQSPPKSQTRANLPESPLQIRIASDLLVEHERNRAGPVPASLSLLSARRPSRAPPVYDHSQASISTGLASYRDVPNFGIPSQGLQRSQHSSSSPEDGGNFRRNLQIDMKDLVGDAVGNMSISPASRDIVLAARRGLFIIDLEAPLEVPRFLPQGGTWDVADVQWNPHRARAEYIVSTSSEKLLIWNLMIVGKTSIEHILHSHYRAITDINWHTSEPDTVCSVGIDSWLWSWDLREPRKPVLGKSRGDSTPSERYSAGGTQVKWNRQDPNVLASSHLDEVLIWDRRKGSLPTARIRAHSAKIYGIDWAHARLNDIITCSLDKTIKVWNVQEASCCDTSGPRPLMTIATRYPVWRARDLPFGRGVLSLPQRGETALEMWAEGDSTTPVEIFEGHTDVVKEFVWRKGGLEGGEYQLITWSKDRTLRFWPVDSETMEKMGHLSVSVTSQTPSQFFADVGRPHQSFRRPPEGLEDIPLFSAPIGTRTILAEVRAAPFAPRKPANPVLQPHHGSAARGKGILLLDSNQSPARNQNQHAVPIPSTTMTMTRGHVGGGKSTRMDAFTWLASVRVGQRRDGSSGQSSGVSSRSRPSPGMESNVMRGQKRKRSESRVRVVRDGEGTQSLQDEITSVVTRLGTSKIRLEKHELTKKRTCTLGLHGPWGESSSVFIRVSFRFPKGYPQASHPEGTPDIELERSPLISNQNRAFMLRRLRSICERRRPCLEACLRFLLFGDENEQLGVPVDLRSDSSSEDDEHSPRKPRDFTVSLLRNHKNLAEPRTSQGVFGPNGELVCFFRAPPRIMQQMTEVPASSTTASRSSPSSSRFSQSPALLADAVRRLELAATDSRLDVVDPGGVTRSDHTLRIMTNLLTFSQQRTRRNSGPEVKDNGPSGNLAVIPAIPTRRSTVLIRVPAESSVAGRRVAVEYIFESDTLSKMCETNALIARQHGQFSHERAFKTLGTLFPTGQVDSPHGDFSIITRQVIDQLHKAFCTAHDVQMLAMIAVVLLKANRSTAGQGSMAAYPPPSIQDTSSAVPKMENDYFSLMKPKDPRGIALSPGWPPLPSLSSTPKFPTASSLSTSNSSRGSWSSLFNTGSVRQFMSGVQDSIPTPVPVTIPSGPSVLRLPNPDSPRRKALGRDQSTTSPVSKSWSETRVTPLSRTTSLPFSSAGHGRRPTFSQAMSPKQVIQEKRLFVIGEESNRNETTRYSFYFLAGEALDVVRRSTLQSAQLVQFACHILAYADVLFRWQLLRKRLELLNAVRTSSFIDTPPQGSRVTEKDEDIQPVRKACGCGHSLDGEICPSCGNRPSGPSCSICRLPVKGLSRSCGQCFHISHLQCWQGAMSEFCGTGCGCRCGGFDGIPRSRSTICSPVSTTPVV